VKRTWRPAAPFGGGWVLGYFASQMSHLGMHYSFSDKEKLVKFGPFVFWTFLLFKLHIVKVHALAT
jgi:hypothetical protein